MYRGRRLTAEFVVVRLDQYDDLHVHEHRDQSCRNISRALAKPIRVPFEPVSDERPFDVCRDGSNGHKENENGRTKPPQVVHVATERAGGYGISHVIAALTGRAQET